MAMLSQAGRQGGIVLAVQPASQNARGTRHTAVMPSREPQGRAVLLSWGLLSRFPPPGYGFSHATQLRTGGFVADSSAISSIAHARRI